MFLMVCTDLCNSHNLNPLIFVNCFNSNFLQQGDTMETNLDRISIFMN